MMCQEKERQMSMLSVDYRQIQQRLQKLEGEHRQETEKVRTFWPFFACAISVMNDDYRICIVWD